jgi:hypothetical protein
MTFTTDFSNLTQQEIYGLITEVFDETSAKRDMDKGNLIFQEMADQNQVYSYQMVPNVGNAQKTAEGANFARSTFTEGHKKTAQQFKYTDSIVITDEMRKFTQQHYRILQTPQKLIDSMFDKIDQSKADIINNAYSTSYTDVWGSTQDNTTADAVAIASDSHTVVTSGQSFGNIIYLEKSTGSGVPNPALSREAIIAGRAMGAKFEDTIGVKSSVDLDTLLVHTDDEDQAMRLVMSRLIPGSGNNDTNSSLGIKNVIAWNRLTSGRFQLFDSANIYESFQCNTAEKPTMLPPAQFTENADMIMKIKTYYGLLPKYLKYMYFSKGTNAA